MLDESLWGVQGEQVWAVYHPVTRTRLGEVSTCAQLGAMCAVLGWRGGGKVGGLKPSLVFYLPFSMAQVCQQNTVVLKFQA